MTHLPTLMEMMTNLRVPIRGMRMSIRISIEIVLRTLRCSIYGIKTSVKILSGDHYSISLTDPSLMDATYRFSQKGIRWELPLYVGELVAKIHLTEPKLAREIGLSHERGRNRNFGQPRRAFGSELWENIFLPELHSEDTDAEFWEEHAPVIQF